MITITIKATGELLEMQGVEPSGDTELDNNRIAAITHNALNAGYTEDEIEVKWVTDEEWEKLNQPTQEHKDKLQRELLDLIKDEVNVKEVVADLKEGVVLDTTITEELRAEGFVRDFVRAIQVQRKEMGLTPKDEIRVLYSENKEIIEKYADQIKKQVIAEEIVFGDEFKIEKI